MFQSIVFLKSSSKRESLLSVLSLSFTSSSPFSLSFTSSSPVSSVDNNALLSLDQIPALTGVLYNMLE